MRPASAQDAPSDDLSENTITGSAPPPAAGMPAPPTADRMPPPEEAARQLQIPLELAAGLQGACDRIYARDYPAAKEILDRLTARFPQSGAGPLGHSVLYQALMLENVDFRYERAWRAAHEALQSQLSAGLSGEARQEHAALKQFVLAGSLGLAAIHHLRRQEWPSALAQAIDGVQALERSAALAPAFRDPLLGDGLYLYWRSVVTLQTRVLPPFPDQRVRGFDLLQQAEREAVFLGPGATVAIVYSCIEERRPDLALERCRYFERRYPANVLNLLTTGRVLSAVGRHEEALVIYAKIKKQVPSNQRVWYQEAVAYTRLIRWPEAERCLLIYLGFIDLTVESRAQAAFRLGQVYEKMARWDDARRWYGEAIRLSGHAASVKALRRLDREGL